jgi:hypothetical protein
VLLLKKIKEKKDRQEEMVEQKKVKHLRRVVLLVVFL